MKVVLYKLLDTDDTAVENDFDRTQVLNEKELRENFYWYLQHGWFDEDNLKNYSLSKDTKEADVMEELDISTIIDIFAENGNYDTEQVFCIEQMEIEIDNKGE